LVEGLNDIKLIDGDKEFHIKSCTTTKVGGGVIQGSCAGLSVQELSPVFGQHGLYFTGLLSVLALGAEEALWATLDIDIVYDFRVLDKKYEVDGLSLSFDGDQTDRDCPLCFSRITETLFGTDTQLLVYNDITGIKLNDFADVAPPLKSGTIVKDIALFSANPMNRVSMSFITQNFTQVPEPTSLAMFGIGLIGLAGARLRRRRS
jgi:hypothetical protein